MSRQQFRLTPNAPQVAPLRLANFAPAIALSIPFWLAIGVAAYLRWWA